VNPVHPPESDELRARIRSFLDEHLPPGWNGLGSLPHDEVMGFLTAWRTTLAEHRWLAASWPAEYGGGGLTAAEQVVVAEEFAKVGAPTGGTNDVFSVGMLGNTILLVGTPEQKAHYIPRILSGEDLWCQGYSEPNAGSDLAGLGCKAMLDGDEWVVNGQKIWTTYGHLANHIFVLTRTDPDPARPHDGITFLLMPMDQPGVEVRPIKMMSGDSEFNEVFFTDARCPREAVLGEVGKGWPIAMTLLGFERGEAAAVLPLEFRAELDRLVDLARERGRLDDPIIRQRIARAYTKVEIMRYLGMRTLTDFLKGHAPGPDAAITKVWWTEYHREATELAVDILGAEAMVPSGRWPSNAIRSDDYGAPNSSASWVGEMYVSRGGTIYAGTSEIQRNIMGERILGLPKEPGAALRGK
jgi:alkylation response protein AidB-like acyl-CoA dehydrogenase